MQKAAVSAASDPAVQKAAVDAVKSNPSLAVRLSSCLFPLPHCRALRSTRAVLSQPSRSPQSLSLQAPLLSS